MNISIEITSEILDYLNAKVESGLYKSRSEAIRNAIREMIRNDLEEQLRSKGISPQNIKKLRKEVAGELIDKKYKKLS